MQPSTINPLDWHDLAFNGANAFQRALEQLYKNQCAMNAQINLLIHRSDTLQCQITDPAEIQLLACQIETLNQRLAQLQPKDMQIANLQARLRSTELLLRIANQKLPLTANHDSDSGYNDDGPDPFENLTSHDASSTGHPSSTWMSGGHWDQYCMETES